MSTDNDSPATSADVPGAPTWITFNATTRAMAALTTITAASGDNKTDAINNTLRAMATLLAVTHADVALPACDRPEAPTSCTCP